MLWILPVSLALLTVKAASPPLKVSLRSSWPAPPFLVELIETVALENPNAFFPFVDRVTDPEALLVSQNLAPEALHQSALQIAVSRGLLPEPGALASVEMNLGLHAATPKIEAFYHHYTQVIEDHAPDCGSWVMWYGMRICDVETLVQLAGTDTIDSSDKKADSEHIYIRPKILPFDHIYPPPERRSETPPRTAILYASFDSPNFRSLHSYLLYLASQEVPHVEYVLRHIPPSTIDVSRKNHLSGYSVSLDLKKMDYLAVDDRQTNGRGSNGDALADDPKSAPKIDLVSSLIENYPEITTAPDASTPLTEDELVEIGLKASQLISESSEPLLTLLQLSQNFPKYATSLSRRVVVNEAFADELHSNQLRVQGGINLLWLNGVPVPEKEVNPFGLLRILKKERNLMLSLERLGLERAEAMDLLISPIVAEAQSDNGLLDGVVDASDRLEEGDVVVWWNDLEKDSRYAQWPSSIHGLLRPLYPGQFHNVRLNLFNIILALDLSKTTSLNFVAGPVSNIVERGFPFRFGVAPLVETEDGKKMARLFYYLVRNHGRKKTMGFLKKIAQLQIHPSVQTPSVQWDIVRSEFKAFIAAATEAGEMEGKETDLDAIFSGRNLEEGNENPVKKAEAYTERLGATLSSSPTGHAFVNGKHFEMNENFLRLMQIEIGKQLQHYQEQIYEGKLTDANNETISTYFYDLPTSSHRRNKYIIPAQGDLQIFNLPEIFERTDFRDHASAFVYPPETEIITLTIYVVTDLNKKEGLELMREALVSIEPNSSARFAFIHNPAVVDESPSRTSVSSLFSHLVSNHLLSKVSPNRLLLALGLTDPVTPKTDGSSSEQTPLQTQADHLREILGGVKPSEFNASTHTRFVDMGRRLLKEMGIAPGEKAILVNGRTVGPIQTGEFRAADFKALQAYELRKRVQPVLSALEDIRSSVTSLDRASLAQLVSLASSVISSIQIPDPSEVGLFDTPYRPRNRNYRLLDTNHTSFLFGDNNTALYQVGVLIDPLTETAQKWSSLLEWLLNVPDIHVQVHLNPARHGEMPLKKFFRYNLRPYLTFDEAGQEEASMTIFEGLPIEPIYTLAMDVPSSWLVRPREALYDLDNIQLGSLSPEDSSLDANFELDYLVIEGHARESKTSSPPRGLQLELVSSSTPFDDTQVVANLGYFQFKATPGVFHLQIREGRGKEIFTMESVGNEGWNSPTVETIGNEITLTSFEGLTLYPRLRRRPGMEMEDVLDDIDDEEPGLFDAVVSSIKGIFGFNEAVDDVAEKQADINIFTVASGLLYERFASIMILSVLRNTKSSVKFWFIENFLSPSFLEFIPHFAEAYNFQYELVTYKWPSWLRAQKEKQRIIWAYKILFLDVLFPMDLKKVIFVDADQIVRADLQELVDLDLHGAPYGYTPMGDDNTDMEGFRFWKTGYWKDFLKGLPYHISALYVVDLVRFRQMAAGDILRGHYQQLSADPNSLANLDQDLPNNLQREVPIFSLDEDWLWCETWCSKDRFHRAKTIDLCQNPLTKEPKLARARQIPEWEEYDTEIARFARKLAAEGKVHSRIAASDVNVLANVGSVDKSSKPGSAESEIKAENVAIEEPVSSESIGGQTRDEL
ncbi:glycosyltransferase family 24 protein [Dendrothele bispora CBS 962.96]|uniref:Glycosyltransferase family 24 protein n=1 Tax=Dendrothele bispora (strain CBS 962.96) TaxID=1314807 RepID=A0A4S8MPC7_DENBC|nr:glycosyltransferase family 24 protein [Dendrothele bispora CBS 962.96]